MDNVYLTTILGQYSGTGQPFREYIGPVRFNSALAPGVQLDFGLGLNFKPDSISGVVSRVHAGPVRADKDSHGIPTVVIEINEPLSVLIWRRLQDNYAVKAPDSK